MAQATPPERDENRGLDLLNLTNITPEEIAAFRASYQAEDGNRQSGFDYLIDNNPAALKTYRYFATSAQPPFRDPRTQAAVFGGIAFFGLLDFDEGVRYCVFPAVRAGITKAQIAEGMALSFMVGGTRAMVTVARAMDGFEWPEPAPDAAPWPEDWFSDPAAFACGLDFSSRGVLPGELDRILGWYEETIGWVPSWVHHMAKYSPDVLKGWRYRYENALPTLPKQVLPMSFLFAGLRLEQRELMRENALLARAWGIPRSMVLQSMAVSTVFGTSKLSTAVEAFGDILDDWD